MQEIVFTVSRDEENGFLVASWDELLGNGGITTQGKDLHELQDMVKEAVVCHFDQAQLPTSIRLHFTTDPILATV